MVISSVKLVISDSSQSNVNFGGDNHCYISGITLPLAVICILNLLVSLSTLPFSGDMQY